MKYKLSSAIVTFYDDQKLLEDEKKGEEISREKGKSGRGNELKVSWQGWSLEAEGTIDWYESRFDRFVGVEFLRAR